MIKFIFHLVTFSIFAFDLSSGDFAKLLKAESPLQVAQQTSLTLEDAWGDANGFTTFGWLDSEDDPIYSSAVYTEVVGNTLSIYNTYNQEPLGQLAMCGGLGCDLGKSSLVATLNFEPQGNLFIVRYASGKANFLQGAQCRIVESYLQVLECTSMQNPKTDANFPTIFRFSPGS